MFWKKLILINASFFVVILQLLSIFLKNKEDAEAMVNKLIWFFSFLIF